MATGLTPTNTTQFAVDLSSFLKNYYIKEVKSLKNKHPFVTFLVISSGIEFLGKAISAEPFTDEKHSMDKFNNALKVFPSLIKYSCLGVDVRTIHNNQVDCSLYSVVRCGIVHASAPKVGIILTEGENDFHASPIEIGLKSFTKDFILACRYLLNEDKRKKKKILGGSKTLGNIICYTS